MMRPTELSAEKLALIAKHLRQADGPFHYYFSEPIAILGLACRFPGADTPDAYWRLLAEERDGIVEVPSTRWDIDALYDPNPETPGKMASRWGGFLTDIDRFDAEFFGISPREAAAMDPQQRTLLEVVWEALEHAGQDVHHLAGSDTGVFAGVLGHDYAVLQGTNPERLDVYTGTGSAHNILAGRIAYLFDFKGPAVALDTACSSSLVAVHAACQSLRAGECTMAVAGGVNLILSPSSTIELSRMQILAPDGRCKTFDARANGFVRSEGCGVVVLKRLADALSAGDPILAVVRGTAVNQDGRSAGLIAPSGPAQQAVLRRALANGGVAPDDVDYVETHGSGTTLGDQIEIEALRAVYGQAGTRPCVLGAVKTNIGHTEAAAGVAGLIKAVLSLAAETIPANLHLQTVNPNLPLAGTRLHLADRARPWPRRSEPRRAAVSAFGWSGTNAHLVLEDAPPREDPLRVSPSSYLLPVSGRSRQAAQIMATRYADVVDTDNLADICASAGVRRAHHRFRTAAVGATPEAMRAALAAAEIGDGIDAGPVVFVYPGQGGQWAGMGRALYEEEDVFQRVIQECAAAIREEAGWDLVERIRDGAEWDDIDRVQPALMAMSVALTAQWRHWGIEPAVVVGHSMGEVAAAHIAGALTLQEAVQVICRRSHLLKRLRGLGGMGVVELDRHAVDAALARYGGRVSIAATNSRRSTVIAGNVDALDALGRAWERDGVYWRRVQVDVASHSAQVDALRADLETMLSGLEPRSTTLRMQSTVTAAPLRGGELDARYWARNLRERVQFVEALEGLVADGFRRFVEVGPHGVLIGAIEEALGGDRGLVVGSLRRGEPDRAALLQGLGALYQWGADVTWASVNGQGRPVRLPAYAWQGDRYALPTASNRATGAATFHGCSIGGERELHVWDLAIEDGHRVAGRDVMPGAAFVEGALRGADAVHGGDWEVRDVHWSGFLEKGRDAQLVIEEDRFRVHSRGDGDKHWQRHGGGRLMRGAVVPRTIDIDAVRQRCGTHVTQQQFYDRLSRQGLEYAGAYRQVREAWIGNGDALTRLGTAKLDPCLQAVSWCGPWGVGEIRVPVRVARVALAREFAGEVWAWARWTDEAGHVLVMDGDGGVVGEVEKLELTRIGSTDDDWLWALQWERAQRGAEAPLTGRWLIVGETLGGALAARLRTRGAACEVTPAIDAVDLARDWRGVVWFAQEDRVDGAVHLVQRMARQAWREAPRLFLVTRGTQAAGSGVTDLTGAGVWGFGRTVMYEHPEFRCTLLDATTTMEDLAAEIAAATDEDQIALRPEARYVARLRSFAAVPVAGVSLSPAHDRAFRLETEAPGVLDRLTWRAMDRRRPGPGEVEIEVEAAGLNFLDVLWAFGEYPGQSRHRTVLGREFAGRVVSVGEGVTTVREGDAVVGCGTASLATHVIAADDAIVAKPDALGWWDAAGQPVAYATAYYSLIELARLAPGERVLIHSAATGTGLAALEIAQQAGAEIWATAGTEAKRAYLLERGVAHVMDSRGTAFADVVRETTNGRGVDVVLNSLSDDRMRASLETIAPYGRFIELGKRDLWDREWMRTEPFRKNLAYYTVDMAAMVAQRRHVFRRILGTVMHQLAEGVWRPLPVIAVDTEQQREAFHQLASGRHLGKVVVSLAHKYTTPIARRHGISTDGAYLISGGLGALGLRIAEWLVEQGARHLVLVSRSAPSGAAEDALARMRAAGATVRVCAADIADRAQVEHIVASLDAPVRGVVHAAAVLADATIERLSPSAIARVWEPKATGAWNLHLATVPHDLDFFVVMSSVAALLGSPGQAHYAAANAWADALVGWRRTQGLPGITIHWGPWRDIGLAAASAERGARLADRGMESLPPEIGLSALDRLLRDERAQASVLRLNLRQWQQYYPKAAASPLLRPLERDVARTPVDRHVLRQTLADADPDRRRCLLEEYIREQAARVLRLEPSKVSATAPFASLGFDSLIAIEFRNRLESALGLKLSATLVWAQPTVAELAEHLAGKMGLSLAPDGGVTLASDAAARIAALPDQAAEAELIEKLRAI